MKQRIAFICIIVIFCWMQGMQQLPDAPTLQLHHAVAEGNEAEALTAIDQRAQLDEPNEHGNTPLLLATSNAMLPIVQRLLERGANVDAQSTNPTREHKKTSALHIAASLNNEHLIRLLMLYGADINAKTALGLTPLMFAARANAADVIALLTHYGAHVDEESNNVATSLHIAAQNNNREAFIALLEAGASVNKQVFGNQRLYDLKPEWRKLLIMYNVPATDAEIRQELGDTLQYAAAIGDTGKINELFVNATHETLTEALAFAAGRGHLNAVKQLAARPIDTTVARTVVEGILRRTVLYGSDRENYRTILRALSLQQRVLFGPELKKQITENRDLLLIIPPHLATFIIKAHILSPELIQYLLKNRILSEDVLFDILFEYRHEKQAMAAVLEYALLNNLEEVAGNALMRISGITQEQARAIARTENQWLQRLAATRDPNGYLAIILDTNLSVL